MLLCKLGLTVLNNFVMSSFLCISYKCLQDSIVCPVFSILLSRVCLDERPFLYDITGCSLKISLSNGCSCTKCTCSLGFLLGLGLLDSLVVLQRARVDLFFPVGVWRVYIL